MKFDLSFDRSGWTRVDQDVSIIIKMHNAAIVHTQQSAQLLFKLINPLGLTAPFGAR